MKLTVWPHGAIPGPLLDATSISRRVRLAGLLSASDPRSRPAPMDSGEDLQGFDCAARRRDAIGGHMRTCLAPPTAELTTMPGQKTMGETGSSATAHARRRRIKDFGRKGPSRGFSLLAQCRIT